MSKNKSLYIPKWMLICASGIEERIVNSDIKDGILSLSKDGYIWYREASQYVCKKWEQGKTKMYNPNGGEPDHNFSSRVLSILDDEIGVSNVSLKWNKRGDSK